MNIRTITADRLTPEQIAVWSDLQQADPALDSPYFRPEFTQAVATVRTGVEIGLLEDGGEPVGFFPFQRSGRNVAMPVGAPMSDFHGPIIRKGVAWEPRELLRACGLAAWHFDHLVASLEPFQPYHWNLAASPYLDLSRGWEAYRTEQLALHKKSFKQATQKSHRAAREAGPLRFEADADVAAIFPLLVQWKMEQYARTHVTNVLAFGWTKALLERVLEAQSESFCGCLSALYMGDTLAAALLSMRSHGVVHAWFSAYNPALAQFSPGIVFWLEMAQAYPELGVHRVDLGKGPERYKQELMSGAIDLAEGSVDFRPVTAALRRGWRKAYLWARCSPLRRPLLGPGRFLRSILESRSFRG